jgi:hypothetical protein
MNAARPSQRRPTEIAPAAADMGELRARRRAAQRKRRLARVDLGVGVVAALALLIASPGLAITGLIALLVLALCVLSAVVEKRMGRRGAEAPRTRRR